MISKGDCVFWVILTIILSLITFGSCGHGVGVLDERYEWAAGRRRVEAGQVQIWHSPLKPGDVGWWEKP